MHRDRQGKEQKQTLNTAALNEQLKVLEDVVSKFLSNEHGKMRTDETSKSLIAKYFYQISDSFSKVLRTSLGEQLPTTVAGLDKSLKQSKEAIQKELSMTVLGKPLPKKDEKEPLVYGPNFTALQTLYYKFCDHFKKSVTTNPTQHRQR